MAFRALRLREHVLHDGGELRRQHLLGREVADQAGGIDTERQLQVVPPAVCPGVKCATNASKTEMGSMVEESKEDDFN